MPKTPGAALGKTDRHRQVWTQTALWAQLQEAAGHQLSMEDVLDDFEERLHKAVSVRQTQADKGLASPEELKELAAWKQKQDSLANKPKQRAKFKIKLMSRCGLRQFSSQGQVIISVRSFVLVWGVLLSFMCWSCFVSVSIIIILYHFCSLGGNRNDDSQARGQAGLAIRGEQSQAGSQADYGAARKKEVRESGS